MSLDRTGDRVEKRLELPHLRFLLWDRFVSRVRRAVSQKGHFTAK